MDETSKGLSQKIKDQVNAPSNQNKMTQILIKMGRVLAKKQSLQSERPTLVYDDRIWLGNYTYANDRQFLLDNKISKVVSCLQLPLSLYLPEISYKQCILKDQEDQRFESLLQDFYRMINQSRENVFVHCFSGKSRSVAFMIYFLMKKEKIGYEEAKYYLERLYPLTKPNMYFQTILKSKENSLDKVQKEQSIDLLDISSQSPKRDSNSPSKIQPSDNILDLAQSSQKDYSIESSNLLQGPILLSQKLVEKSNQDQSQPDYNQLTTVSLTKSNQQFQNLIQMENSSSSKPVETNLLDLRDDAERNQIDLINIQSKSEQINQTNTEKVDQQAHKNEQTNLQQKQDQSEIMIENANFSQKKSKKTNKKKKK